MREIRVLQVAVGGDDVTEVPCQVHPLGSDDEAATVSVRLFFLAQLAPDGVEGTVHCGPDWSDEHTGRYRITNWEAPPHYDILRGPVCLRLKRWGHPILALGPGVARSRSVVAAVTYTFYAGSPCVCHGVEARGPRRCALPQLPQR